MTDIPLFHHSTIPISSSPDVSRIAVARPRRWACLPATTPAMRARRSGRVANAQARPAPARSCLAVAGGSQGFSRGGRARRAGAFSSAKPVPKIVCACPVESRLQRVRGAKFHRVNLRLSAANYGSGQFAYSATNSISTRRFARRPSLVVFGLSGFSSPLPTAVMREGVIPWPTR